VKVASDAQPAPPEATICTLDGPVTVQGSITVASPVQVTGTVDVAQPVRMVSAESDPTRHVQIHTPGGNQISVIAGPFFLTDIWWTGSGGPIVYDSDPGCPFLGPSIVITPNNQVTSGMRFFIPEGRWLCAIASSQLSVAGFRPY